MMDKCIHDKGYCEILSDNEVKQPCIEGPCKDEKILKHCPFCGGEAYLNDILTRKGRDIEIGCRKCGIKMLKGFIRFSFDPIYCRELAIEAWNRRAT